MNRTLTLPALTLASLLALTPVAGAQAAPPQPAQPGNAMPGQPGGRPMSAAFTLVRKVDALNVIGRDTKTAFSSAQAAALAKLLSPLRMAKTLTAAQAASVSAGIDRLLTPAQRPALQQAENQMGGRRGGPNGQGPNAGGRMPNGQPQGGQRPNAQGPNGQLPNRQSGQMQGSQMRGGPMQGNRMNMAPDANPFLSGRGGQILGQFLTNLQK